MQKLLTEIVPEMFQLAASNKLRAETETVELKNIEKLWNAEIPNGKRLVVTI